MWFTTSSGARLLGKILRIQLNTAHINNKLPIAREGLPFVGVGCIGSLLLYYAGLVLPCFFLGLLTLFVLFFFRDPDRTSTAGPKAVLTPADGKILHIRELDGPDNPLHVPAIQISIFMSLFDVHVNRIPVGGNIQEITYRQGKFFAANLDKASAENESNQIRLQTADARSIVTTQIAGLIARRIDCWISEGDRVEAGQRFGLIRFGSRLEVYVPIDTQITAKARQHVKAGETVLGYLA